VSLVMKLIVIVVVTILSFMNVPNLLPPPSLVGVLATSSFREGNACQMAMEWRNSCPDLWSTLFRTCGQKCEVTDDFRLPHYKCHGWRVLLCLRIIRWRLSCWHACCSFPNELLCWHACCYWLRPFGKALQGFFVFVWRVRPCEALLS
jgi:hypothetical protein